MSGGWLRFVEATNYKDVGTLYLLFVLCASVVGTALSIFIRLELHEPGLQFFTNPQYYKVVVTAHGLVMIFFVLMPALVGGFGNWIRLPGKHPRRYHWSRLWTGQGWADARETVAAVVAMALSASGLGCVKGDGSC